MIQDYTVVAEATKDSDQSIIAKVMNPERFSESETKYEFYCAGMLVAFEKGFEGINVSVIKD